MDVLESEHLLQARLANTVAYAAMHAHPHADIEKGAGNVHAMYVRSLDAIPYFTAGMDAADNVNTERIEAIRKWRKMRELEKANDG